MDLAQQNKAKITQQLETDKQKIADTKKLIGQIATQAYKSGGVPSNLTLFFGSNNSGSLTDTMDLADQAMRSQNSAMDKLTPAERHQRELAGTARRPSKRRSRT